MVWVGLLLVGAGIVGVPVGLVFWIRAPRGRLLHRTLVVLVAGALWALLTGAVFLAAFNAAVGGAGGTGY